MDRTGPALGAGLVAVLALAMVAAVTTGDEPDATGASTASPSPSSTSSGPSTSSSGASSPFASPPPTATQAPGPPLLLPNMRSMGASQIRVQGTGRDRVIRFSAALGNLGPGPLLLRPAGGASCPVGQHSAIQLLHRDGNADGRFQQQRDRVADRRQVGCMLKHPTHDHWHFDAMASYTLRLAGTDRTLASQDKVSFCLRDNVRVPGQPVVVRREHFGECSRRSRQGISPGWIDIYTWDLDGQALRLPRGVDGDVLCLDLAADPRGVLLEIDETDNATSLGLVVEGDDVRRVRSGQCRP